MHHIGTEFGTSVMQELLVLLLHIDAMLPLTTRGGDFQKNLQANTIVTFQYTLHTGCRFHYHSLSLSMQITPNDFSLLKKIKKFVTQR